MAEAADNEILKRAVSVIAAAPPMQNVIAFLIVLMLAAPLIRAGWREFRKKPEPAPPPPTPTALIQETPWLIQTLTRIQFDVEQVTRDVEGLTTLVRSLSAAVAVVDRIMRLRASKRK